MNRLQEALNELKELNRKISIKVNVEKRKSFSLKSDLDHITNLKKIKQELREEIDSLQRD
jgi:hypothetical protein|tara:strand:+ start:101 stop:280 length:180 start_codon:yes stop_codon:yes gene_type:complete